MERPARRDDGSELYPDRRVAYNNVTAGRVGREPGSDRLTTFVCECGRLGCNAVVDLTLREYAAVRTAPRQFAIAMDHQARGDRVMASGHSYVIVTRSLDCRSRNSVNNG